jgi:hypothetical protein
MGACRLGLAIIAVLTLIIAASPDRASAGAGQALAALKADAVENQALAQPVLFHHSRRVESYYCYPRNYWWFYRPYTTGQDGHARCMPYFKYPTNYGNGREAIK